jgi:hypothetical protein
MGLLRGEEKKINATIRCVWESRGGVEHANPIAPVLYALWRPGPSWRKVFE